MKILPTAAAACMLAALLGAGAPLRAEEDCDSVVTALEEAISIATKNLEQTVNELQKMMSEPADDKKKASVKNIACSATGELLGTARASHAIAAICRPEQGAAIDKSIREMEAKIDNTCK
jgi:predicted  nucleic acid-binding Zn-ribbon protein